MHFQAYLVEGLMRWNQDRMSAAVASTSIEESYIYSVQLRHAGNKLAESVFGKKLFPHFQAPRKYTGKIEEMMCIS
jgi:hypothetical protein